MTINKYILLSLVQCFDAMFKLLSLIGRLIASMAVVIYMDAIGIEITLCLFVLLWGEFPIFQMLAHFFESQLYREISLDLHASHELDNFIRSGELEIKKKPAHKPAIKKLKVVVL